MSSEITSAWAVAVKNPCPECKGGGRIQVMDGITNRVHRCATCKGKGHLGLKWVRLRDLHRYMNDDSGAGEVTA